MVCIVGLLLMEGLVRANQIKFRTLAMGLVKHKSELLDSRSKLDYDAIILGDSQILRLDAKYLSDEIAKQTGHQFDVYNFAIPNHGIRTYYLLLDRYLKNHHKPKYIILAITPIATTGEWTLENSFEISNASHMLVELYSLGSLVQNFPFKTALSLVAAKCERISTLILYRAAISDFLRGRGVDQTPRVTIQKDQLQRYNGGNLTERPVPMSLQEIREHKYYNWPIYPDHESLYWYKKACDLAKQYSVPLIIINAPIFEEIMANREADGSNDRYKEFIAEIARDNSFVRYDEGLLRSYGFEYFEDWHHLNQKGAQRFTKEMVLELHALLSTKNN